MSGIDPGLAYEFCAYRVEPRKRLVTRPDGQPVTLTDKAYDTLQYLVERAGQLVTKEEMLRTLWPHTIVEESSLYVVISALRRALADDAGTPRMIATVTGRGYQFVADVRTLRLESAADTAALSGPAARRAHLPGPFLRPGMVALIAATLIVAVGAAVTAHRLRAGAGPSDRVVSLAILPFKPLTPADRNESLEFGMAETLISGLNSGGLSVKPLSSVRRYADPEQDGLEAGRELGVQAVLEGSIQHAEDQLRVSARLLNVSDGRQLWAQRYDVLFTDIFSVQDTIASRVREALTSELEGQNQPALRRYTDDSEAYQLYAAGRLQLSRLALQPALASFNQAVERDPRFALAYVGIADAHAMLGVFGVVAPHLTFPQARRSVDKALQIAPDLGEAYASLGHIKFQYEHDWIGAERALRRAIELNPNDARVQRWIGLYLAYRGQFDRGLAHLRSGQALEPELPAVSALIGLVLMYERNLDAAIEHLRTTLELDPHLPTAHAYLASSYIRRGEYEAAMEHLHRAGSLAPGSAASLGQLYALSGRREQALQELERLVSASKERYVSAYDIATIHATLGNVDEAIEWLGRAFEERSQLLGWLPWDSMFDELRSDPRYRDLVSRLGLNAAASFAAESRPADGAGS